MAVESIFQRLIDVMSEQQTLIKSIAEQMQKFEGFSGGGGDGNASILDYESGMAYKRNTLLVDRITETVYRVTAEASDHYVSDTVEQDCANGYLKLVGFESQIVTFDHNPTQAEINTIPDDALVAVYSSTDKPYVPSSQE